MSETHILIRLLRIYFPRISEFGTASEFPGGLHPPTPPPPPRYTTDKRRYSNLVTDTELFLKQALKNGMVDKVKKHNPHDST
jgi:hypothetical protein